MSEFSEQFRADFDRLLRMRRDVRRFRTDPIPEALLTRCLGAFDTAPSVGLSQPWRLIQVDDATRRAAVSKNFKSANDAALTGYVGERAQTYAGLKLAGLDQAPVHLAVFCDNLPTQGHGLGVQTMPEMYRYSVVCAVTLFWLAARAEGLGLYP